MHSHHVHPYALQVIAFAVSCLPVLALAALLLAARFLEGRGRAAKPGLRGHERPQTRLALDAVRDG